MVKVINDCHVAKWNGQFSVPSSLDLSAVFDHLIIHASRISGLTQLLVDFTLVPSCSGTDLCLVSFSGLPHLPDIWMLNCWRIQSLTLSSSLPVFTSVETSSSEMFYVLSNADHSAISSPDQFYWTIDLVHLPSQWNIIISSLHMQKSTPDWLTLLSLDLHFIFSSSQRSFSIRCSPSTTSLFFILLITSVVLNLCDPVIDVCLMRKLLSLWGLASWQLFLFIVSIVPSTENEDQK